MLVSAQKRRGERTGEKGKREDGKMTRKAGIEGSLWGGKEPTNLLTDRILHWSSRRGLGRRRRHDAGSGKWSDGGQRGYGAGGASGEAEDGAAQHRSRCRGGIGRKTRKPRRFLERPVLAVRLRFLVQLARGMSSAGSRKQSRGTEQAPQVCPDDVE